jgi:His-Xaa-Ser system radical SAM maturase HxsC
MLPRHTRANITGAPRRTVLKVLTLDEFVRTRHEPEDCAIWNDASETLRRSRALEDLRWGAVISPTTDAPPDNTSPNQRIVTALRIPGVVAPGDVIRISERNSLVSVLYRRGSSSNALLVTERCNSYCIMCSQPPIERDDSYRVQELLQVIRLIDTNEPVLGITGGEPTLLGPDLIELIASLKSSLPSTRVHILTNGRRFNDPDFARQVAAVGHDATVWAIPLYSDGPEVHDYVVQRQGAFDETLHGLLNLARLNQRVELRVVIQQATVPRLPQLAHFIARNLTFVDHVAWMGLEPTGFARPNWKSLWIEPEDYTANLEAAVTRLDDVHMTTSIYNVPLCVLPERLHRFAARSISDWKNNYLPECDECSLRSQCCGFFASATRQHLPRQIRPVPTHVTTSGSSHG